MSAPKLDRKGLPDFDFDGGPVGLGGSMLLGCIDSVPSSLALPLTAVWEAFSGPPPKGSSAVEVFKTAAAACVEKQRIYG